MYFPQTKTDPPYARDTISQMSIHLVHVKLTFFWSSDRMLSNTSDQITYPFIKLNCCLGKDK